MSAGPKSKALFAKASERIPGGVNSPVRAFKAVGGTPLFIDHAKGDKIIDVDGREYIDFIMSWGPGILGHSHPGVVKAVQEQAEKAFSYGMSCELEFDLADYLCNKIDGLDMVRFVSSGTEATMSAIRLARGFSEKEYFIKFEGCYHGHSDSLLVKAGSGLLTFGTGSASSAGVPEAFASRTIPLPYNDIEAVKEAFSKYDIAGIILEPVPGNMGLIRPEQEFLQGLRDICDEQKAVLIFDEVMCGFRVNETTAADLYGVMPDLFCFGKVIGGGMPVGAFGGKKEIMQKLAPLGEVYQAGTLSGNPLAMRAGLETISTFFEEKIFAKTDAIGKKLKEMILPVIAGRKDVKFDQLGSMFCLFFHSEEGTIRNFDDMAHCDQARFGRFFNFMLDRGMLLPPSQFEANFLSATHSEESLTQYVEGVKAFLETDI